MESKLLTPKPAFKPSPPRHPCPQTWQVATVLCFLSVFFLSGVLLGSYLGLMHRCRQPETETAPSNKLKLQLSSEEADKVPFIEILNSHEHIFLLVKNSTVKYTLACNKATLEDLLDDNAPHLQRLLSSLKLYDIKYLPYPVMASQDRLEVVFGNNKEMAVVDESLDIKEWTSPGDVTFDTDVKLAREVLQSNDSVEGMFVLMEFHPQNLLRNVTELAGRKAAGMLLYSSKGECLAESEPWLHAKLHQLGKQHNIHIQVLACGAQGKLLSSLEQLSKDAANSTVGDDRKGSNIHLTLQSNVKTSNFTNVLTTFYGSRDPDLIVLVGSSRYNVKGTERWLKVLGAVTQALLKDNRGRVWSPYRSLKLISWSQLGVQDFLRTYGEAWKHKVLVYLDLDNPDTSHPAHQATQAPANKIQVEASSSLKPFLDRVVQQLNFNNPNATSIEVVASKGTKEKSTTAHVLERSMGIPYLRILKMPTEAKAQMKFEKPFSKREQKMRGLINPDIVVMKLFTTAMLSVLDGELLQVSTLESVNDVMTLLTQLVSPPLVEREAGKDEGDSVEEKISDQIEDLQASVGRLQRVMQDLRASMEMFSQNFESVYQVRKTNELLLREENELRVIIHQLSAMLPIINSKPLDENNYLPSYLTSVSYLGTDLSNNYFLSPHCYFSMGCVSFNGQSNGYRCDVEELRKEEVLWRLSQINRKIQGLARLINIRE